MEAFGSNLDGPEQSAKAVPVGRVPGGVTANRRENLDRAAKSELVGTLGEVFKSTTVVVVAHYAGLTVAQMQNSATADEAGGREREGGEEPPGQDRSGRL